jgi:hypothetical protein
MDEREKWIEDLRALTDNFKACPFCQGSLAKRGRCFECLCNKKMSICIDGPLNDDLYSEALIFKVGSEIRINYYPTKSITIRKMYEEEAMEIPNQSHEDWISFIRDYIDLEIFE